MQADEIMFHHNVRMSETGGNIIHLHPPLLASSIIILLLLLFYNSSLLLVFSNAIIPSLVNVVRHTILDIFPVTLTASLKGMK